MFEVFSGRELETFSTEHKPQFMVSEHPTSLVPEKRAQAL